MCVCHKGNNFLKRVKLKSIKDNPMEEKDTYIFFKLTYLL